VAGGLAGAVVDLRTGRIPNGLSIGIVMSGFTLAIAGATEVTPLSAAVACVMGFVLMLPGHVLGATGAGDVKLFSALSAILGAGQVLEAFCFVAITGGMFALAHAWRRGRVGLTVTRTMRLMTAPADTRRVIERRDAHNRFPYGPAIALGSLVAALT